MAMSRSFDLIMASTEKKASTLTNPRNSLIDSKQSLKHQPIYTSYILAGVLCLALCACKDNSVHIPFRSPRTLIKQLFSGT